MFLFDNTKALKRSLIQMQDNICKIPVYFPRLKHDGNNDNYKSTDNSGNNNINYSNDIKDENYININNIITMIIQF